MYILVKTTQSNAFNSKNQGFLEYVCFKLHFILVSLGGEKKDKTTQNLLACMVCFYTKHFTAS